MAKQPQQFDVCIVCALYEEAKAVIEEFQSRCGVTFTQAFSNLDQYEYRWSTIQNNVGEPLTVLVSWLPESGPVRTGLDLRPFLQEFRPRFAAMTGFCAGFIEKVHLGDLVIAEYAYHYEEGKVTKGPDGQLIHQQEMKTAHPPTRMIQYARGFDGWKEPVNTYRQNVLKDAVETERFIAPMASGMAVRADNPFPWLIEYRNRKTLALEMEAATFYLALRAFPGMNGLVVKSVADYADNEKSDDYHTYASHISAIYMLSFIRAYVTEQTMPRSEELFKPTRLSHESIEQLEQLIGKFKLLRGEIASYWTMRGTKGFNLATCESQYQALYADAIAFLTAHLPDRALNNFDGFTAAVQRKFAEELHQRTTNFTISLARQVFSSMANFEKVAAQIDACTTTLEEYKQKYSA